MSQPHIGEIEGSEWNPMDVAPKDGTAVDLKNSIGQIAPCCNWRVPGGPGWFHLRLTSWIPVPHDFAPTHWRLSAPIEDLLSGSATILESEVPWLTPTSSSLLARLENLDSLAQQYLASDTGDSVNEALEKHGRTALELLPIVIQEMRLLRDALQGNKVYIEGYILRNSGEFSPSMGTLLEALLDIDVALSR